jgi:hypothetical protein
MADPLDQALQELDALVAALAALPADDQMLNVGLAQLELLKPRMRPAGAQDVRGLMLTTVRGTVGDLIRTIGLQLRDGDRRHGGTIQRMCGGLRRSIEALRKL